MRTMAQVRTQAQTPAAPVAARMPQPAVAVPKTDAERPDIATQLENAARLGHSFAAISVHGPVPPVVQSQEAPGDIVQRTKHQITNSRGETHTVSEASDIIGDLTQPFKSWKQGYQDTSGHSAQKAETVLASEYNTLANRWKARKDKTAAKSVITFGAGSSLSGGHGVKHLTAATFEDNRRYSFVWHVRHVPD